ncbi:Protein SUP-1 [Dirofilaria immitis]
MHYIMLKFVSLFLLNYFNINSAQVINDLQEIITKDDDIHKYLHYLWCPPKLLEMMCPDNSLTYYYYCCGDLKNRCCYATRTWVISLCLAVPVLMFIFIVIYLLRKIAFIKTYRYVSGERQT